MGASRPVGRARRRVRRACGPPPCPDPGVEPRAKGSATTWRGVASAWRRPSGPRQRRLTPFPGSSPGRVLRSSGSAPAAGPPTAPCGRAPCLGGERLPRCSAAGLSPEGPGGGQTSSVSTEISASAFPDRPRRPASPTAACGGWCDPSGVASRGTPALRALDRPMAMACFVERAPCFPVPDVVHLLVNELPGRGRRALSFPEVLPRLLHGSLLGHDENSSVSGGWESCVEGARVRRLEQSRTGTRSSAGGRRAPGPRRKPLAFDAEE